MPTREQRAWLNRIRQKSDPNRTTYNNRLNAAKAMKPVNNAQTDDELTFGVEIEIVPPESHSLRSIALYLKDNGINANFAHRPVTSVDGWKVTTDSSCGFEIVSPVLSGEKGLNEVKKVVKLLKAIAKVNAKCGLHVHIGAQNMTPWDIRNIYVRYARAEFIIDGLMPKSRQESNNHACLSLDDQTIFYWLLKYTESQLTLDKLIAHQESRYCKLNLHALRVHGTIEYRHHGGTLNHNRVINWIKFCLHFSSTTTEANINKISLSDIMTDELYEYYQPKAKPIKG